MGARVAVSHERERFDVRAQLAGAERAVDAHDQRLRVLDRRPEGVDRLPGERAAGEVDDRDRDPERDLRPLLVEDVADGGDSRLRVQRVEDRLDEQEVDAAVDEPADGLRVALPHVVERHDAVGGIVHTGRERERLVQRAERPGHEARPVGPLVARLPGEARALEVELVDDVLEAVVGLADRRRRKGVRRRDVGARVQVGAVDVEHDVGARQVEQVRVAGNLAWMVAEPLAAVVRVAEAAALEHRPPGPVQDDDALREQVAQAGLYGDGRRRHMHIVPLKRVTPA